MEIDVAGIAHLEARPDEDVVLIGFANAEGHGVMLRLPGPAITQTIAALASEGGKLAQARADKDRQVLFPATGCELAVTDSGDPILLVQLQNGLEMPLQFESEALSSLFSALNLLRTRSSTWAN